MLGDWGGHRSRLAEHGLNFDIYSTNFFNGVANGGLQETFQYRGRMDYLVNIDGEKAGLWKGLFIDLHGETVYGNTINQYTGTLSPVSIAQAVPIPNGYVTALTGVKFTQALSETVHRLRREAQPPRRLQPAVHRWCSRCGRVLEHGVRVQPGVRSHGAVLDVRVRGRRPEEPGADLLVHRARRQRHADHERVRHVLRQRRGAAPADQHPDEVLRPAGPPGDDRNLEQQEVSQHRPDGVPQRDSGWTPVSTLRRDGSWSLAYMFDQALVVSPCDPKRMWGVFGNVGIADTNPSPVRWFANLGVGGSALRGRPLDTFGLGYYYMGLNSSFKNLVPGVAAPRRARDGGLLQLRRDPVVPDHSGRAVHPSGPGPSSAHVVLRSACEARFLSRERQPGRGNCPDPVLIPHHLLALSDPLPSNLTYFECILVFARGRNSVNNWGETELLIAGVGQPI